MNPELIPLLVVRGGAHAIDFYVRALGAKVLRRYEHGAARHVSHADLAIGDATFSITEEARAWNSDAPVSLGGSPVVLQLEVADAGAALSSLRDAGATVIFPLQDLFGARMARLRDPFGHIWILHQRLEALSVDEIQRQRDELFARFTSEPLPAVPATPPKNADTLQTSPATTQAGNDAAPQIHLILGPVGAGKSTFALELARQHAAIRLTLDEWMAELFSPDRPDTGVIDWYVERASRCIDQIWRTARAVVATGTHVVLELGLLRHDERQRFYQRVNSAGSRLSIYVLDAARDVRRERVNERNRSQGPTFSMIVPPAVFEFASDLWEPLTPSECDGRDVRFIRTDGVKSARR